MSSSRRRARREARQRAAKASARAVSAVSAPLGTAPSGTAASGADPSLPAGSVSAGTLPPEPTASRAETNRANALRSTGPRTPEGKARSRRNALTHGLYARTLAGSAEALGEDLADFEALHESLAAEYAPEGLHEERMVERLALLWWRLDRLSAHAQQKLASALAGGAEVLPALLGSEAVAVAESRLERAIARLHRDLLFLARYRQRATRDDPRQRPARAAERLVAETAAEAERMLQYLRTKRMAERRGAEPPPSPAPEPPASQGPAGAGEGLIAETYLKEETQAQTAA